MPLFLSPPPQRIHVTRRNFTVPAGATLQVEPLLASEANAAVARLLELFPKIQRTRKADVDAEIRLVPWDGEPSGERPATDEALTLTVTDEGIKLAAGRRGLLYGVELLRQLAGEGDVVGVQIEDWPAFAVRELYVPLSPDAFAPSYWPRLLDNLSRWRFNRLSLPEPPGEALAATRAAGSPVGIDVVTRSTRPERDACVHLLDASDGGVPRWRRLAEIQEAALRAVAEGKETWCVDTGAVDAETFLDTLAYGIAFAGACGWNPRKAELKAHRRSFAAHFFGPEAAPAQDALEALEAGLTAAAEALPGEPDPLTALFREPPFAPERSRRLLRGIERAREIAGVAARAEAAVAAARESATRNGAALALLEWPARRMAVQAEHVLTMHRARESYADAFLSESSPKAVSQRVLRAAEMLEALANRVSELEDLLVQLWPLERAGEPPEVVRALYRERIDLLREKAQELRAARDTYIQTGRLAAPEALGLDRSAGGTTGAAGGPGRAVLPGRLPTRHSPAWWIDGGVARIRVETRAETAGIPWEVMVNFRALAGDEGTFNVRRVRLARFDDVTDTVGSLVPCQLTRTGLVFLPDPGEKVYYLYLDPTGAGDEEAAPREDAPPPLRVRQSRDGIVVEGPLLAARVEGKHGILDRWRAGGPDGVELLDAGARPEAGLCRLPETPIGGEVRVRVIEQGPLLVRIRAESEDGRIRQYDFYPGMSWCEFALNAPVTSVRHALDAGPWRSGHALLPTDGTAASRPLDGATAAAPWAARTRPDGLTFAVLAPDTPARHELTAERHDVQGEPDLTRLVLWCHPGNGEDPQVAARLGALAEALRHPPSVQFGPVEERRTREF